MCVWGGQDSNRLTTTVFNQINPTVSTETKICIDLIFFSLLLKLICITVSDLDLVCSSYLDCLPLFGENKYVFIRGLTDY